MSGWLDDGSETISGNGPLVSCTAKAQGDAVFHGLWKGDGSVSSGIHYWEVENKGGLGAVGMTTADKFKKGYGCKSFNFNSINLSDGGALLVGQYGSDAFQIGDKVGLLCEMTDGALTIVFYLNGRCLGPAFHVASPYPTELYPVVTFKDGGSSAAIAKIDAIPQVRTRQAEPQPFPEGFWSLIESDVPVTLDIRALGQGVYRASMHVINRCNVQLTCKDGTWASSPGMMTMMMGPENTMVVEQACSQKLQNLNKLDNHGGRLVISSPSGDLIFQAATPQLPIPYTENVLA